MLLETQGVRHVFSHIDHRSVLLVKNVKSADDAAAAEQALRRVADPMEPAVTPATSVEFRWFPLGQLLSSAPPSGAALSSLTLKHLRIVAKHT